MVIKKFHKKDSANNSLSLEGVKFKIKLVESLIYKLEKMNKTNHYFLIDINLDAYSVEYENDVINKHTDNIYFLECFLRSNAFPIKSPIHNHHKLESFISSAQFYKNAYNVGVATRRLTRIIQNFIDDLDNCIAFLQAYPCQKQYLRTVNTEDLHDNLPKTLNVFLLNLKETSGFFKKTLEKLNN